MKCLSPKLIRSTIKDAPDGAMMYVSCKKCVNCLAAKRQRWTYRMQCEMRYSKAYFVSLDYDPEHQLFFNSELYNEYKDSDMYTEKQKDKLLNISNKDVFVRGRDILLCPLDELPKYDGFVPTVYVQEIQNYMKRVRKNEPSLKDKLKYYAIGEYGGDFGRNHYHLACFTNKDFPQTKFEQSVIKSWPYGRVRIDMLCDQLISYITKYMNKEDVETPEDERSLPCFSTNSNNLGKRGFLNDYYYLDSLGLYKKYRDIPFRTTNGARVSIPKTWRERYIDSTPMDYTTFHDLELQDEKKKNDEFENYCRTYFPNSEPTASFVISSYLQATDAKRKAEISNMQSRFKHSAK